MLLVSGRFSVSKTIIPKAGSTFSSLQYAAGLIFSVDWGLDDDLLGGVGQSIEGTLAGDGIVK